MNMFEFGGSGYSAFVRLAMVLFAAPNTRTRLKVWVAGRADLRTKILVG
jgi:hypothetical protein